MDGHLAVVDAAACLGGIDSVDLTDIALGGIDRKGRAGAGGFGCGGGVAAFP